MPTIYPTVKLSKFHRRILLLVLVVAVGNYCMRLFELRLGLIPFEERLQVSSGSSKEEFSRAMSWIEFGLIAVAAHGFFALMFALILVRELAWRIRRRPTTTILSLRMLMVVGLWIFASAFSVFLFLNPQEAQGTRAAGPPAFTGAMITFGIISCYAILLMFWKRPQASDHMFRINWRKNH